MIDSEQASTVMLWSLPTAAFTLWFYLSAPLTTALSHRVPALAAEAFLSLVRKFSGGFVFAILWLTIRLRVPAATETPSPLVAIDLVPTDSLPVSAAISAVVALVLASIVALSSRTPEMHLLYPEFRQPSATPAQRLLSAASWMVYLAGYELLFRGIILGAAIASLGLTAGIAAHTSLYVLAHLHKPAGETLSCFLMGPLFAWLAMDHGIVSVWLVHCAVAITGEQVAGTTNPRTLWKLRQ